MCEHCKTPIIRLIRGRMAFEMDLDPNCITKKNWKSRKPAVEAIKPPLVVPAKPQQKSEVRQIAKKRKPRVAKPKKQKLTTKPTKVRKRKAEASE